MNVAINYESYSISCVLIGIKFEYKNSLFRCLMIPLSFRMETLSCRFEFLTEVSKLLMNLSSLKGS